MERFATVKYDPNSRTIKNAFMHLTNYSVNKKSGKFVENDDTEAAQGHKWSLRTLFDYLRDHDGINVDELWSGICDLVVKVSAKPEVSCAMRLADPNSHVVPRPLLASRLLSTQQPSATCGTG